MKVGWEKELVKLSLALKAYLDHLLVLYSPVHACSFWTETNNPDAIKLFMKRILDFPWLAKSVLFLHVPMSFSPACSRILCASCQPSSPSFFEKNFQKSLSCSYLVNILKRETCWTSWDALCLVRMFKGSELIWRIHVMSQIERESTSYT